MILYDKATETIEVMNYDFYDKTTETIEVMNYDFKTINRGLNQSGCM